MKSKKLIWILLSISLLATIPVYFQLPDQIPRHWDINGNVNGTWGRAGTFVTALLPFAFYLLFLFLPKIDPKRENYPKFQKQYNLIALVIVMFMVLLHWLAILAAVGLVSNMGMLVKLFVGLLFVLLGNVMPKLKFNYFMGIRTPWTLANEEVWRRTHRVGGIAFTALGALIMILAFFQGSASFIIFMAATLGLVGFTFVYSYLAFRKYTK